MNTSTISHSPQDPQPQLSNLEAALDLWRRGYSVIPVHAPGMPLPPTAHDADIGKVPLVGWKEFQRRLPTEQEIQPWWTLWPQANVGIVTGQVSRVIVLDVDGQEGAASLRSLPPMPETPRSSTGRGEHIWFIHPGGEVANFASRLPGLDLRGDGGFVVVPPSTHSTGRRYEWSNPGVPELAQVPASLLDLIWPQRADNARTFELPARITEGKRNDTLYRVARSLKVRGASHSAILAYLQAENLERCDPPLPDEEIVKLAANAVGQTDRPGFQQSLGANAFLPPKEEVGKETNFAPIRADVLLATPPKPIPWVWEPFIAEGTLNLLTAFMKVGKSTILYPLAIAMAQRKPFLGYPTRADGVLILAVEGHPRDVRAGLEKFGIRPEDPIYIHQNRLDHGEATIAALRIFITDNSISLVILDTLTRYWDIKDENANAEVVRRCTPFLDLARETGCAVLLVHHDRKSGGEGGRGIRGGSALLGLVDQAIMLDHRQGGNDNQRVLRTLGRYEDTPGELVIELRDDEYVSLGTSEDLSKEASQAKVLGALDDDPKTVDELAIKTDLSAKAIRGVLPTLEDSVDRGGPGLKGAPFTYRRKPPDSFPSQPHPIGEETNS